MEREQVYTTGKIQISGNSNYKAQLQASVYASPGKGKIEPQTLQVTLDFGAASAFVYPTKEQAQAIISNLRQAIFELRKAEIKYAE